MDNVHCILHTQALSKFTTHNTHTYTMITGQGSSQEHDPQWHVDRLLTRGSSPYRHAFVEPHLPLPNIMERALLRGGTATILSRPCRLKLHISNNKHRSEINIK